MAAGVYGTATTLHMVSSTDDGNNFDNSPEDEKEAYDSDAHLRDHEDAVIDKDAVFGDDAFNEGNVNMGDEVEDEANYDITGASDPT